jgi:hypothetical protein
MVEGASAEMLRELLSAFEGELENQGVPLGTLLAAGVTREYVLEMFARVQLTPPDEVVVLYEWRNGITPVQGSEYALPMFAFPSIERTVEAYLSPTGWPKGDEDWQWKPDWIQIMGQGYGLAVCTSDPPADPPLARGISVDGEFGTQPDQALRQVVSLCTPVAWWVESLIEGWYRWDSTSGRWDVDPSAQPAIRNIHGIS